MHRVVNFCWFFFKWGLLAGLIGVVVAVPYVYRQVDSKVRCQVEATFARHYSQLKVTVRQAEFLEGKGIEFRDLSIVELGAEGPQAELLHLDEVFLTCRADLDELVSGQPNVTHVLLRRPTLRVTRRPDGTYGAAKLLPLPRFSAVPPDVTVADGTIEIFDPTVDPSSTLVLRNVNLSLLGTEAADPARAESAWRKLEGTFDADHVRQVTVSGLVEPDRMEWSLAGVVEGLNLSPRLLESLPSELAARLAPLKPLRGKADFNFQFTRNPAAEPSSHFRLDGELTQGRVDDARLPTPLADLRAAFRVDNKGLSLVDLFAYGGPSTLQVRTLRLGGFDLTGPLLLDAEIRDLELNRSLLNFLPDALRDEWPKYFPSGRINADVKLSSDGKTWSPDLTVECQNVSFSYFNFPYRLEEAGGTIKLKFDPDRRENVLSINLRAFSGTRPVRVTGTIFQPGATPYGNVHVKGEGLELDEKLIGALKEKPREILLALAPHGTIDVEFHGQSDAPGQPLRKDLYVALGGCSMRYQKFPYPLGNIRGRIEMHGTAGMQDDRWTFSDLQGGNDTGRVICQGSLKDGLFELALDAWDVPLERELRDALAHPNIRKLWDDLKLQGTVDLEDIRIQYLAGQPRPHVSFRAIPRAENTSIELACFPYRLDKLQGTLDYRDGGVTIRDFQGSHGGTKVSATTIDCGFLPNGSWQLGLGQLAVDRLHLDRELTQALPESLRKAVESLKPTGPVNLLGAVTFQHSGDLRDPVTADWDLSLVLRQGSLDAGVKLRNINGQMTLVGGSDGERFHSLGELTVESLEYKNLQFTEITGPVWIDRQRVLFGTSVDRGGPPATVSPQRRPQPIKAKLFGGDVKGGGWVELGDTPTYRFAAGLEQADLTLFAQEFIPGRQALRGKMFADVDVWGSGRSLNALGGRGSIRLRDADIYELPLMISLLKILSIREPDPTAFSESDIDFVINGNHVYLTRIDFKGDAISLVGEGEMDLQSNVNLVFGARLGRGELNLPLLRDLLGEAGDQMVSIRVEGPLAHPKTYRVPFPVVNKVLQQLQSGLQGPVDNPGIRPPGSGGLFPQADRLLPANSVPTPQRRY